jgi:hypothetical protein
LTPASTQKNTFWLHLVLAKVMRLWYECVRKRMINQDQPFGRFAMDHNLAFACIGYGSVRAVRAHHFSKAPYALPAQWILEERDPVEYCVEAMRHEHPDWAANVDAETRLAIHHRLTIEAQRAAAS